VVIGISSDLMLDNVKVNAVGIFKSELKARNFPSISRKRNSLDFLVQQGNQLLINWIRVV